VGKVNVLLTGGNGYLAKSLHSALKSKYNIISVTRNDFDMTDGNAMREWFQGRSFDAVVHTAIVGGSRLRSETSSMLEQNLLMHYNLMANKGRFSRFIEFGSGAEIFAPETPYGLSKRVIANSIRETPDWHNIRIFGVFDENELSTRFIKASILRYLNKEPIQIHTDRIMDFFYMKDLVSVVDKYLTEKDPPKEVNCSYRDKHTLSEIAAQINELGHHRVEINIEQAGMSFYCGQELKLDVPLIGFYQGLKNTYDAILKSQTTL
jgi:dTDP-4-dehydrorhamnose reductase